MKFTEKSRLRAVLNNEPTDRPPVICPGGMMSAATTAVLRGFENKIHSDPAIMAAAAEAIRENTGFENLGVPFCMTVEAEVFGSTVDLGDAGVESCITEYGAKELATVLNHPISDPAQDGRAPVILSAIKTLASRNADVPIIGNITGPISLATSIIDPLFFFRQMRKAPDEVMAVLNHLTDYLVLFIQRQVAAGADVIAIADPTATGEILGNANFRQFVIPMLERLVPAIRQAGANAIVHICGDATVLLDALKEVEGAAFSFDSMVNLSKAKIVLQNIPVMGNLNTQMLHIGEPQRIIQNTKMLIEQGTHIIAPACGISLATPRENLQVFTQTVKSYAASEQS